MTGSVTQRVEKSEEVDLDFDRGDGILLEIADDARRLKNRYPTETIVPEGGE